MSEHFITTGQTIGVCGHLDLSDSALTDEFVSLVIALADRGARQIAIDFSQSPILSSAIISLTFLAVRAVRDRDVAISVTASISHHRPLVSAGMPAFVDLRLCG